LRLGQKKIKNKPQVNETLDDQTLLKTYRKQIHDLQRELELVKEDDRQNSLSDLEKNNELLSARLNEVEENKIMLEEKLKKK